MKFSKYKEYYNDQNSNNIKNTEYEQIKIFKIP